jgi:hypothetical protein
MPNASRSTFRTAVLLLLVALSAECQTRPHAGAVSRTLELQDSTFNMQAVALTLPPGWQGLGAIDRSSPCSAGDAFPHYRLVDEANSSFIIHLLPFVTVWPQSAAGNTNLSGCGAVAPFTDSSVILTRLIVPKVIRELQGAQVGRPEPIPGSTSGNGARVHVSYTDNGLAREEYIFASTVATRFPGNMGGTTNTAVTIVSAPQGKPEEASRVALNLQVNMNPRWEEANNRDRQQRFETARNQSLNKQAAIYAQGRANLEASQIRTQQTIDNIHAIGAASMKAAHDNAVATHNSAMETAAYVGDKIVSYPWRNTVTGATTSTNSSSSPGPNWVPNN